MFIPEKLINLCSGLIQGATMESRVTGQLIERLSTERNLSALGPVLAAMSQTPPAVLKVGRNDKYRGACWLAAIAFFALAWQYSWAFLPMLIPVALLYYRNRKEEYDAVVFLSALMLSLEILSHDFAGWGTAYPKAKRQAHEILVKTAQNPSAIEFLDFILLQGRKAEPDWAEQFAPYARNLAS